MELSTGLIFLFLGIATYPKCETSKREGRSLEDQILKQAINMSEHFMDSDYSVEAKKDYVLDYKKKNAVNVVGERRMLNHEVRVVQGRCDINKQCPANQYCDGIFCFLFKKNGDSCDLNGECEKGTECQFGVCAKGVSVGDPGTFCDLAKDCSGDNQCCIRELSISKHTSICKPMLKEHESCGPINLFHQAEMKAHVEPLCGPCEKALSCKGIGIYGRHSICLPNDEE